MPEASPHNDILSFEPGTDVLFHGQHFRITHVLDLTFVLAKNASNGEAKKLPIADLRPYEYQDGEAFVGEDLENIPDRDWREAQRRMEIIRPLLTVESTSREQVQIVADTARVNTATIYRWMKRYRTFGKVSALVPYPRGPKPNAVRLRPELTTIVEGVINDIYLNKRTLEKKVEKRAQPRKRSPRTVIKEVYRLCRNAGLEPPHPSTIRRWITRITAKDVMRGQRRGVVVEETYGEIRGKFPDAHWPLEVVQIDHTRVDIILVDDKERLPIGRPWITLAIDVFSRMVCGFYVSIDPPGNMATGLCLVKCILPKEAWLLELDVPGTWPVWGKMRTIHADNAGEFRGEMLKKACIEHHIDLTWRPVKKPRYGAHIERLLGTLHEDIHELDGSTYSNIEDRADYDPEKDSCMTLSEFEQWLAELIVNDYHQRIHGELKTTPLAKYEEGIFGTADRPGIGLPDRIMDESRLRLDLMPFETRTVQRHGIVWDGIEYYSDVLRKWIGAKDPENTARKRKFIVRRDPRDISVIYFFDPELKQYFEIPYRNIARPSISLWELRAIRRFLKEQGKEQVDEEMIFQARERMREIEEKARTKTKAARRKAQRKRGWEQAEKPKLEATVPEDEQVEEPSIHDIRPFDEIDEDWDNDL